MTKVTSPAQEAFRRERGAEMTLVPTLNGMRCRDPDAMIRLWNDRWYLNRAREKYEHGLRCGEPPFSPEVCAFLPALKNLQNFWGNVFRRVRRDIWRA